MRKLINSALSIVLLVPLVIVSYFFVSVQQGQFELVNIKHYYLFYILFSVGTFGVVNHYIRVRLLDPLKGLSTFTDHLSKQDFQKYSFYRTTFKKAPVKELVKFEEKYYELLQNLQINEEEIYDQNEALENSNKEIKNLSMKLEAILNSFTDSYKMEKQEFLKKAFESVFSLIGEAEKGTLFELKEGYYHPMVSEGYDGEVMKALKFKEGTTFVDIKDIEPDNIMAYREKIYKNDTKDLPNESLEVIKKLGTYVDFECLYAPIVAEGKIQGMISLDCFNTASFSDASQKLLTYYAQLISEFYSQRIREEKISNNYLEIVKALVSTIEIKDAYTKGHGQRVRKYSTDIAEAMNLPKDMIRRVDMSALLHDIGKIGIPEEILNKPGRLTMEEYEVIKRHPEFSRIVIEKISGFDEIAEIVYCHHEYYNGKGYPRGLSEKDIPIESQIIQIADAFDAMTSNRSYRKALSKEKAIEIMRKECGEQFNPDVVEIAIRKVFNKAS